MIIFAAALDWGLGHTTRLIPVLQNLVRSEDRLIIGATERQKIIFLEHFPEASYIKLPKASPVFGSGNNQNLRFMLYLPVFMLHLLRDRIFACRLVNSMGVGCFISDNRYGLRHRKAKCIFITHQICPVVPKFFKSVTGLIHWLTGRLINEFDECLVPDFPDEPALSGKLGRTGNFIHIPVKFIGPQSRLGGIIPIPTENKPELLIILSGPENQRTVFERIIEKQLENSEYVPSYLVIRGLPGAEKHKKPNFINHVEAPNLKYLINEARYIICRSGYSTIMDLAILGKTACIVPTPGQSEQEYLAEYHAKKGYFLSCRQDDFYLPSILKKLDGFKPDSPFARGQITT